MPESTNKMSEYKDPILYVLVIGFHHKKGCQVEYSFPPLVPGSPNECPAGWKYLPTLALPDGAHNYNEDTVYFHLPSLANPRRTVYGISCFRQIPVEKLKNLTADITRGTVQKSVCVLSKVPLYGHIQVKMALITHAYFDEGDFSKVSLLEDTYHHLNSVIMQNDTSLQTYVGLSARDFILQWRHKAVLLFKLLLLEKRVVFYKSPVHPLCTTILTLLSLHPGMIENGLHQSACIKLSRPMSPMPNFSDDDGTPESSPVRAKPTPKKEQEAQKNQNDNIENPKTTTESTELDNNKKENELSESTELAIELTESNNLELKKSNSETDKKSLQRDNSTEMPENHIMNSQMSQLALINIETCGFPLGVFRQGYLCLPYLSLPYLDLLSDVNVRGYVMGATNILFKQKRQLYDILVDIDACRIECQDLELRKQLHLTTEDLRFADYIVKHVSEEKHDVFLDGVGWEGGDEWIRSQFKIYLLCLLRTSLLQDGSKEMEHFNTTFMSAWKDTHNYKMFNSAESPGILEANPGHPFAGQLSVSDMKLRLSHTMQNTEGGRKLNQAMVSTGRAVATTSKAVGGAISHAKGAFSNWFSNLLVSPDPVQKGVDAMNEENDKTIDNQLDAQNDSTDGQNDTTDIQNDTNKSKETIDSSSLTNANQNVTNENQKGINSQNDNINCQNFIGSCQNVTDISQDIAGISPNVIGIGQNVTDISQNATDISQNVTGVSQNVTDCCQNISGYCQNTTVNVNIENASLNKQNVSIDSHNVKIDSKDASIESENVMIGSYNASADAKKQAIDFIADAKTNLENATINSAFSKERKELANGIIMNDKKELNCKESCNSDNIETGNSYKIGEINTV